MNNIKLTQELEELLNERTDEEKEIVLKFYAELIDKCKVAIERIYCKIKPLVDLIKAIINKFRNHDELIKRYFEDIDITLFENKFGEKVLDIRFIYVVPKKDMKLLEYKGFDRRSYDGFYENYSLYSSSDYYLTKHDYIELEEIKS